ncbi:MAG: 16S rRNA (guanine(527)-N(7))-methyltransferase RsmG [Coriobacteriia bacterium]|nr:16S rRNA (guanine(527)-N(7))-methyltransferase RsmG [Coriobacteriia bacterium]
MWEKEAPDAQKTLSRVIQYSISEEEARLLDKHLSYVLEQNKRINLTSIENRERAMILHIEDSLVALPEIMRSPQGRMADLGSGGGFPGIPLAIVTKRETTLVEATKKKAALLSVFIQENSLQDRICVEAVRIEELARRQRGQYAVVTARALAPLPVLLELATPLLCMGGALVAYKAGQVEEEAKVANKLKNMLGMEFVGKRELVLSDGMTKREIMVYQKFAEAERDLPRRNGQAQHRPLI